MGAVVVEGRYKNDQRKMPVKLRLKTRQDELMRQMNVEATAEANKPWQVVSR